jgi:Na+/H+-dicarboxylate symporter
LIEDWTMLFLITSVVSLAIGFVLGRVWEIRQGIKQQIASDPARQPSVSSDRHAALADRLATPRDLFASHNKSQMGF